MNDGNFLNRATAGRMLATRLQRYAGEGDVLVLALPRGGVPVGFEVAAALKAELDVLIVRKLGVPGHEEFAMGAIASGGAQYLNEDVVRRMGIGPQAVEAVLQAERAELARREKLYRGARPPLKIEGRTVILVDDGMATGASIQAAVTALRSQQPKRIVVAVPVAPADAAQRLADVADEFVCVQTPANFYAVGQFYGDFGQTSDAEVRELLQQAGQAPA